MRFLGIRVPFTARAAAVVAKQTDENTVTPLVPGFAVPTRWGLIVEAFAGMWQRNLVIDNAQTLLAFAAVFACVSLISGDIAKLRIKLLRKTGDFWSEDVSGAFSPVLRKPNRYQTRLQFVLSWMASKLIWGNTYVLKQRDERGLVVEMHVLDPAMVRPLVAPDGAVFYRISADNLSGSESVVAPASEIIHDRGICLFHPLIGVPPLYACALSATEGSRIQTNSAKFFENMSRPSGHLSAPGTISQETAARMKEEFERGFSGTNVGRLLVTGDNLKFEPFTMPPEQAQLIEQLKWTGEDVARAFLVPPYKIGLGTTPSLGHVAALNQEYYQQVLQVNIEAMELLLDDGLRLPADLAAELDLDGLLRMDPKTRAQTDEILVKSAARSPNEIRAKDNFPPVAGGESPYLQQQNFSLAALAKRDAKPDPFLTAKPPPAAKPPEDGEDDEDAEERGAARLAGILIRRFSSGMPRVPA